jgi:CspA family cold shock protein
MAREKGVVKWFSKERGYGFVRRDSGEEIFVHHSDIEMEGFASLRNGEAVEFEVFQSDRGPKARKLIPLASGRETGGDGGSDEPKRGERKRREGGRVARRDRDVADAAARRGRSGEGGAHDRPAGSERKTLAAQLEERLGRRFPGFGS